MTSSPSQRDSSQTSRQASLEIASDSGNSDNEASDNNAAIYASDLPSKKSAGRPSSTPKKRGVVPEADSTASDIVLSPYDPEMPYEERAEMALKLAAEVFAQTGSWVVFYREIMGCDGVVWKLFPEAAQRRHFEASPEFAELLEIMTSIRSQDRSKTSLHEPERMITVRLPRTMHATCVAEASELGLSINNYCLTKLLQPINKRFTPIESGPRRGRRPGPQIQVEKTADGEISMQRIRVPAKSSKDSSAPKTKRPRTQK
ncbi:hypothetical protein LOC71_00120 [Rhodopirellula sp. JC740]|uniref:Toxin-antitoxin system HicB family antitoxin n=1 Tax=Rhodopirellula halodulae TaxID=2894198 RepID=A0ABS8NDW7_9BACT|nr:hypothetical protein [Rhodopirellula sp. JC740]MCC9640661.1 hypothetical protein [Rhodopirellula sp. JC740]